MADNFQILLQWPVTLLVVLSAQVKIRLFPNEQIRPHCDMCKSQTVLGIINHLADHLREVFKC